MRQDGAYRKAGQAAATAHSIRVEPLAGGQIAAVLPVLAQLRMRVFRAYPYLYDGSLAYEQRYLEKFAAADGAVIVAAWAGDTIVGAATASPMRGHADAFAEPYIARGYEIDRIFYCGESVLLAEYRGLGIGHAFFDQREAHARALGGFRHAAFCAVMRPDDHPLRPPDYQPLDGFWRKRGYAKLDGVVGQFSWKDIDRDVETSKPMQFWMKEL